MSALNDSGAITGMDVREDGVYITYVPSDGADAVSKKLDSYKIANFNLSVTGDNPKLSWTAPGNIIRAGMEGGGGTSVPGGNGGPGITLHVSGNTISFEIWKIGGNINVRGFAIYE